MCLSFVQKISSKLLSPRCLLNCSSFCNQTCSGGVLSWAAVSCGKELGCYHQGQGHSEGLFNQNMAVSDTSPEWMIFWFFFRPDLVFMINHHTPKYRVKGLICCVQGQGHSKGSKFSVNTVCMTVHVILYSGQESAWQWFCVTVCNIV